MIDKIIIEAIGEELCEELSGLVFKGSTGAIDKEEFNLRYAAYMEKLPEDLDEGILTTISYVYTKAIEHYD